MAEDIDAIPTHVTAVVRAEQVSPTFRRLTFGGGLERFASIAPDEFVYVLVPPPGRTELAIGTDFTWLGYYTMDEADRPVGAYYTVREFRPEAGELDVDVFLHDEPGATSGWAAIAGPGDPAALWGPRTSWARPATPTGGCWPPTRPACRRRPASCGTCRRTPWPGCSWRRSTRPTSARCPPGQHRGHLARPRRPSRRRVRRHPPARRRGQAVGRPGRRGAGRRPARGHAVRLGRRREPGP